MEMWKSPYCDKTDILLWLWGGKEMRNQYADSLFPEWEETSLTERHEIFEGSRNRGHSKAWGCWVALPPSLHRRFHTDRAYALLWKEECQKRFEAKYGHAKFMEIFGRNYINASRND